MLLLASIGLPILGSLIILGLSRFKKRIGLSWLTAIAVSLVSLGLVYYLRLFLPSQYQLPAWLPLSIYHYAPFLQISYQSWPYAIALMTLVAAVIITDPSRTGQTGNPRAWAALLALTGVHLLAITAGDPLTLIFAWMAADIIEFSTFLSMQAQTGRNDRLVSNLGLRWMSLIALMLAVVVGWQVKPAFTLAEIPGNASLLFLLAAALRLGVLPIYLPYLTSEQLPRGIAAVSRLIPAITALTLIAHLPGEFLTLSRWLITTLHLFALLAAVYASLFWLSRENLNQAKPYWTIALSAFVVQSALNGNSASSQAWGLAMLLSGGALFLFDPPIRRIRFLPLIALIGLLGLPFTPAASGWHGLTLGRFTLTGVVFIISHALLVLGYLRYTLSASSTITGLERHVRYTFPLGLILIIISILIIGLIGSAEGPQMGAWLAPLISLLLVALMAGLALKLGLKPPFLSSQSQLPGYRFIRLAMQAVQSVFSLAWVYTLAGWVLKPLRAAGEFLISLLEGEGGTIWMLVFIVILLTLFITRISLP